MIPGRARSAVLCSTLIVVGPAAAAEPASRPNILLIAVDDLNHWVGHLGRSKQVRTPNIDRLAARGVTFTRAYCAAPLCNPSRAAILSGLRPSTTGIYDNPTDWRPLIPEALTLPSHLRKHGYRAAGAGKIYHGGFDRRSEWDDYHRGGAGRSGERVAAVRGRAGRLPWAQLDAGDDALGDHHVVTWASEELGKKHEKPFFLAVGLYRPHLPWNVPRKYFDMYPLDAIELPPFREDDLADLPPAGVRMANPGGDHAAIVKAGAWKEAIRAYLASVTYADHQVGRLLDALDRGPHRESTVVVLWGDHGWHLGEKHHWRKFTLWEEAARVPFIWVVPGVTKPGGVCGRTVDLMSVYPTIAELAGLPVPAHVEGSSVRKLLADPAAEWSLPALTTHGAGNHSVRSEGWRYIRYADGGEELYDETADPYEWTNLAEKPEHAAVKAELARRMPPRNAR
jgi:arylsulfatase A-like enzyme